GPVFFNAKRIGKNGKLFKCYKFRSMYQNADELLIKHLNNNPELKDQWNKFQKLKGNDIRVTKIGFFIRKYSLDELPQIFNVLKGDMSLVGPRPYLPREKELMNSFYNIIITTLPGITGYWQVSGRSNVTFKKRLEMDNWYIRNWSIWIDIIFLIKTIKVVFCSKGAV
ncbi:MAG TPA: sugar transferase, partial [Megamonas funiformis]|nr:sugar transferase [Megamonas funiformis]